MPRRKPRRVDQLASAEDRLKKAIAAYCEAKGESLNGADRKVLDGLASDGIAAKAFVALDVDDAGAERVLDACIQASELARDFEKWREDERLAPARMDKLDKSVADLRAFIEELARDPRNKLAAWIDHDPADWRAMRHGLGIISGDIAARRRIALETLPRIGAGRKVADLSDTKAIGWLAIAVQRITGKPNTQSVAVLATVVLQLDEPCTESRVIKARNKLSREWRLPLSATRDARGKRI